MKEQIGEVAGKLWSVIGQREFVKVSDLPKFVDGDKQTAYMALGWLAREGKIEFAIANKGEAVLICLSDKEKGVFKKSRN